MANTKKNSILTKHRITHFTIHSSFARTTGHLLLTNRKLSTISLYMRIRRAFSYFSFSILTSLPTSFINQNNKSNFLQPLKEEREIDKRGRSDTPRDIEKNL